MTERLFLPVCLLLCRSLVAADLFTSFEFGNTSDPIYATNLDNCTTVTAAGGYWVVEDSAITLVTNLNKSFGGTFAVNGTNYDGSGSRSCLHIDVTQTNTWGDQIVQHMPTMPNAGLVVSWGVMAYLTLQTTNVSQIVFDFIGDGTVFSQTIANPSTGLNFVSEGLTNGGSTFGTAHQIPVATWLWWTGIIDRETGAVKTSVYNPSNWTSYGESVAALDISPQPTNQSFNLHDFYIGDNYADHGALINGVTGCIIVDNLVMDWSSHTYPLLPQTTVRAYTFNSRYVRTVKSE